jgi:2-dehydro-3-deoxyphosphogluconate aldolase/(4S)-4-hydroxy-2-oxoglutarate aldolase
VIPVISALEVDCVDRLGDALKTGGLPVAEVTLRNATAVQVLQRFAADRELLVGAGTVVRPDQVDLAADAGARFIVTPGISARVIHRCHQLGLPVIPGISTPTEIIAALDLGCEVVKFFPAQGVWR